MVDTESFGRFEETACEDRISELPEVLLITILALLPTKDAVFTMFLSKRWRYVWTKVYELEYIDSDVDVSDDDVEDEDSDNDDNNEEVESKKSVWWFLDKTLQLHNAPVIHKLYMELGRRCPTDVDIGKWIAKAVDSCVLYLKFELLWSADPTSLPNSIYSCKSLVALTLSHKVLVDVPSPACLSSLKELYLNYVVYKDEDSIVRLLSGCPVLETFVVKRKKIDNVKKFSVKVPSLLSFEYENNYVRDTDDGCLIIDTPTLKEFIIQESSRDYCSIENIPCLEGAYIDCISYPDDRLLRSLSSVLRLCLQLTNEQLWCFSTINFSRLVDLTIQPRESDWLAPLMVLLGNSSELKTLLVDYEFTDEPEQLPLSWNQPTSVPRCLLSQLELFEWMEYGGREEEEQFLTYILAHSKCLKIVEISLRSSSEEEQMIMERKLRDIPMASETCQFLFE